MIREILKIFMDKTTALDQMSSEFSKMLFTGKDMFVQVTDLLYLGGDKKVVYDNIYPADKELNKLECKIRGEVVTHISVSGSINLSAMLIFMSVVKDAERIGDYIKNTYEVVVKSKDFKQGEYAGKILNIRNNIVSKFDEVKTIFKENDRKKAAECIREISAFQKECDVIVNELIESSGKQNSVAYALVVRYFKRILAHLSNIVTAVVMPVNKLDYFDEDTLPKP